MVKCSAMSLVFYPQAIEKWADAMTLHASLHGTMKCCACSALRVFCLLLYAVPIRRVSLESDGPCSGV